MTKLAIVGSRNFCDERMFLKVLGTWIDVYGTPSVIISGGAKGADTFAEKYAEKNSIQTIIHVPNYAKYKGYVAPLMRNTLIVDDCDAVLAFPSKNGSGTQDTIKKAQKANKDVTIYYID